MLKQRILAIFLWSFLASYLTAMMFIFSSEQPVYRRQQQPYNNDKTKGDEVENKSLGQKFFPDSISFFTFSLVLVTGGLVVIGIIQANAAKQSADVAKDTLIATQRPWVLVKLQLGKRGLFFNMNEANLDLVFLLKNTGNSPAVAVRIEGGPRVDVAINDRIIELEKICSKARNRSTHPKDWGYTIFPGDELVLPFTYSFANKKMLEKIINEERGFIDPIVIGCIDYLFTFGELTHHQSRFVYTVDYYPLPQGGLHSINVTEGNKPTNLLRISPWFKAGSFQAD